MQWTLAKLVNHVRALLAPGHRWSRCPFLTSAAHTRLTTHAEHKRILWIISRRSKRFGRGFCWSQPVACEICSLTLLYAPPVRQLYFSTTIVPPCFTTLLFECLIASIRRFATAIRLAQPRTNDCTALLFLNSCNFACFSSTCWIYSSFSFILLRSRKQETFLKILQLYMQSMTNKPAQ